MDTTKDYELKISYMKDHLGRMWQRFNYMLSIQTAIAGGKILLTAEKNGLELCVIGFIFAVMWYILGAQDRYLFKLYQAQVANAFAVIVGDDVAKVKSHVGQVEGAVEKVETDFFTWRRSAMSSTKMAAIVPMVIGVLWVVYLLIFKPL